MTSSHSASSPDLSETSGKSEPWFMPAAAPAPTLPVMMEPLDLLSLAPRRLRSLFPIALLVAIHFFPAQTEAVFWAKVRAEARQMTSLLRVGIEAGLHHARPRRPPSVSR